MLGPARGRARPTPDAAAGDARAAATSCTATRCACSSWSTRCSTSRASRPAASQARYEPTDLARAHRAIWPARSARRSSAPACARRSTARRCPSRSTSIATCGRRSSSTCSRTRSSSRSRARSRSRCARAATHVELTVARHRRRHPAGRAAAPVRALPPRRGRARRARTKAPASAWRWCRSWCGCTAATIAVDERARRGHDVHRHDPARHARTCRRTGSARADAGVDRRAAPTPFVDGGAALAAGRDDRRRRRRRRRAAGAGDDAAPRDPARRRQRRHARLPARGCSRERCDVEAVADGAGGARGGARAAARPGPHRRDDAAARRLRAAARRCAPIRRTRDIPVILLSARAGEEARVEGLRRRRRRLPGQAVLARASCSRASSAQLAARAAATRAGASAQREPSCATLLRCRRPSRSSMPARPGARRSSSPTPRVPRAASAAATSSASRCSRRCPELDGQECDELLDARATRPASRTCGREMPVQLDARQRRARGHATSTSSTSRMRDADGRDRRRARRSPSTSPSRCSRAASCEQLRERGRGRQPRARTSSWRCSATSCATRSRRSSPRSQLMRLRGGDGAEQRARDHRAAGRPPGAAGRRPARRLAHHARQGRAATRAPSSSPTSSRAAIEMASPLLEQRRHTLDVDVPRDGLRVDGDPTRLAQVVVEPADQRRQVHASRAARSRVARARDGERRRRLRVRDNGIGIAPEMLPRIFDLFVQERQALDRAQGGLGLGLALVRSLVELHGGTVDGAQRRARARAASSSSRCRWRPTRRRRDAGAPRSRRADGAAAGAARPGRRRQRRRRRAARRDRCASSGHEVEVAHDGPSALAIARDVRARRRAARHRPAGDGRLRAGAAAARDRRACRAARASSRSPATARTPIAARAREAGFDAHLVKPVDLDALARSLAN